MRDPYELLFFPAGNGYIVSVPPPPESYAHHMIKSDQNQPATTSETIAPDQSNQSTAYENKNVCYQHYKGRCTNDNCDLIHYLRLPKEKELCRFYGRDGQCVNQQSCLFMHSEFPCKFYHLGITHPIDETEQSCAFSHGDAIDDEDLAKAVIVEALRTKVLGDHSNFHRLQQMFDLRKMELVKKCDGDSIDVTNSEDVETTAEVEIPVSMVETEGEEILESDSLETILNQKQMDALAQNDIKTLAQIVVLSIEQQRAYGLSIDQIHSIHLKAIQKGELSSIKTTPAPPEPVVDSVTVTSRLLCDESNSSMKSCDEEPEFLGFATSSLVSPVRKDEPVEKVLPDVIDIGSSVVAEEPSSQTNAVTYPHPDFFSSDDEEDALVINDDIE